MKDNRILKQGIKEFNMVIFGGDGDLSKRKIIPAIYQRYLAGQLDVNFNVICISRSIELWDDFENYISPDLINLSTKESYKKFIKHLELVHIPENKVDKYNELKEILDRDNYQRIFYFSVPSRAFGEICTCLDESKLIEKSSKLVLEKPLGNDLKSSIAINDVILSVFDEEQVFRIDHYLGKETVQNLMVLRFANPLFERAWNGENIDYIQITVAESIGVEKRAGFYDKTGALLDMVQNHLLQLLCLVTMEPPASLDPDVVRNEKLKALQSLRRFNKSSIRGNVVRGQYARGVFANEKLSSYLEDIEKYNSETETFVAIKAFIDNWRWKNTPIYLRTGKRLKKRYSEIVIQFKELPHSIFGDNESPLSNKLIIRLQPEERIELVQLSKVPGPGGYRFKPISLKLDFIDSFQDRMPDAYERLLIDVIRGNQTLFMRHDELVEAWKWIESINKYWAKETPLRLYEAGSWGPGGEILEGNVKWSLNY